MRDSFVCFSFNDVEVVGSEATYLHNTFTDVFTCSLILLSNSLFLPVLLYCSLG